jgi:hypothetical protein
MFNDFNNQDNNTPFFQDDDADKMLDAGKPKAARKGFKFNSKNFLGMTPSQRFLIATMLMVLVCLMGSMVLLVTGSISLY